MRIDLNYGPQVTSETSRASTQNGAAASGSSSTSVGQSGEDQAHLSGAHTQVEALTAQASQLPEIRQERVQSLRQSVLRGNYQPASDEVAGAIVESMFAGSAV